MWLSDNSLEIIIAAGVGTAIFLLLNVARAYARRTAKRAEDKSSIRFLIASVAARTSHFFMIMAAARLVAGYADPPTLLFITIRFLFTIATVFQVALWLREFILGLIERRSAEDGHGETLANAMGLIRILVTVALFAIALVVVLDNLGVNVTGLVAGLGIGGIAIGLAAQGIFSDLFAALSIIFDKPFKTGEIIQYDQTIATVERIGLKSTRLRAVTGEKKIISNANLLQKEISNFYNIAHRQISFPIGVIYQTDIDVAQRIPEMLKDAIEANGGAYVRAAFLGFGPSSLNYECIFDVYEAVMADVAVIRQKVGLGIVKRFREEGIEFAYPTQTTFTAAPDGEMIYPYPEPKRAKT
ncbi:MAG: mechanosensitive ion channel domain-containing protein [Sphingobium sp.]